MGAEQRLNDTRDVLNCAKEETGCGKDGPPPVQSVSHSENTPGAPVLSTMLGAAENKAQ